ncbi:MAG TPA: orotate phosphoribosyltransferase [Gemmatimonadaceae bacterium]
MDRTELASAIATVATLRGKFRLRSGALATDYFDKYRFESDPTLLGALAQALVPLVPSGIDALAGLELGGIPLATALSLQTGLPALFVRKRAKDYGTCRLAEGGDVTGRCLLIVEDVVTSGGQVLASCEELRRLGGTVEHALCVIDREAGGREALHASGVELHALFRRRDLDGALDPIR